MARHGRARPGSPQIIDAHFPTDSGRKVPGVYTPKAKTSAEEDFLAIGHGAHAWLGEAAAVGASRMRVKMADAVTLSRLHGLEVVDEALGVAAVAYGRFASGDLASLLANRVTGDGHRANEQASLAQGTSGWEAMSAQPQAKAAREDGETV